MYRYRSHGTLSFHEMLIFARGYLPSAQIIMYATDSNRDRNWRTVEAESLDPNDFRLDGFDFAVIRGFAKGFVPGTEALQPFDFAQDVEVNVVQASLWELTSWDHSFMLLATRDPLRPNSVFGIKTVDYYESIFKDDPQDAE